MDAPLLLDLSHTSHTRARTGVQRVARSLARALAGQAFNVCYDPYEGAWRPLDAFERRNLVASDPSPGRGARWPLSARLRGRLRRLGARRDPLGSLSPAPRGVLVPEIFSPGVGRSLPSLFAAAAGPRVALFHDAIALQFPEFAPRGALARFPGYLQELLQFDGVAAVSDASRRALLDYWAWIGVRRMTQVATIGLGLDPAPESGVGPVEPVPTILCVGSIEGRKNHVALLEACESLWSRKVPFRLHLVGLANTETGREALARIQGLVAAGRPLRYDGPVDEAALDAAYKACSLTVYPSLAEGFGLPVAESLSRGRPCLCRMQGALGEIARGGGCVDLGAAGPAQIAGAIEGVLAAPAKLAQLSQEARSRRFKTWEEYAGELTAWMRSLGRNA